MAEDEMSMHTQADFRRIVWMYYKKSGRHDLLWRKTKSLYRILVSEVMLQQTQVERVIPFYKNFMKQFGTVKKLADAPLAEVLKAWQGLGYNRRAKMLHRAAKELPSHTASTISELESLSGVGPYTARAIAAFAWNQDVVVIETNIRTAVIHHFFPQKEKVSDTEIEKILLSVLPKGKSREWYSALMDYGAYLKRSGVSHNGRSTTYTKQSKFQGSLREARGAILRELSKKAASRALLESILGDERKEQVAQAIESLCKEGFISRKRNQYTLAH